MSQKYAGGQAVIEGVMMRYENRIATAIRKKGKIVIKKEKLNSLSSRYKIFSLPFIRGVFALFEMLYIGTRTLMWSAKENADEDDIEIKNWQIGLTVTFSLLFGIGLFVLLPYALTYVVGAEESSQPVLFNIIDGILKVAILLIYVYLIGFFQDIRRVFQYHGAEHKAINMFEANANQDLKTSRKFTTIHNRCGTNFLFIVTFTGIFIFAFLPLIVQWFIPDIFDKSVLVKYPVMFTARILVLPVIAGISYEWLRLNGRFPENRFIRFLSLPGRALQRLTTKEPTPDQVEVAFAALNAVLPKSITGKTAKKKRSA